MPAVVPLMSQRRKSGTASVVSRASRYPALEQLKNPHYTLNPSCLFGSLWPWKHLTYLHLQQSEWWLMKERWEKGNALNFGLLINMDACACVLKRDSQRNMAQADQGFWLHCSCGIKSSLRDHDLPRASSYTK